MFGKNDNDNSIKDDELEGYEEKKSIFGDFFRGKKKKKKRNIGSSNDITNDTSNIDNSDISIFQGENDSQPNNDFSYGVRKNRTKTTGYSDFNYNVSPENDGNANYNTKYINANNKTLLNKIIGLILDIVIIGIVIMVVIHFLPGTKGSFSDKREIYANRGKDIALQVQTYFSQEGQKCTTNISHQYYFNIYNSKEQFGDSFGSPFFNQKLEGYIRIEHYDSGKTDVFVTLTDGVMGINNVNVNELDASDVGLFTFLGLDHFDSMSCEKPFVFSNNQ